MGTFIGGALLSALNFAVLVGLWRPPLIEHGAGAVVLAGAVLIIGFIEATAVSPAITWLAWLAALIGFNRYVVATADVDGWEEAMGAMLFLGGAVIISIVCAITAAFDRPDRA
jgi:hypothetical protein